MSVDWAKIFGDLAKSLSDFLMEMDFGDVAKSLSSIITTALDSMLAIVDNTDFGGLGKQFSDFVNNIDYRGIISKLGQLIAKIIIGAFKFITSFSENLNFSEIADGFIKGIIDVLKDVDWLQLAGLVVESIVDVLVLPITLTIEIVKSIVTNAWETRKEIGEKIGGYIREHIEAADGDISEGLKTAIEDAISGVTDSVKKWINQYIVDPILRMFGLSDEQIATAKKNLKEHLPEILKAIPETIKKKFDDWIEDLKKIDLTKVGEFAGRIAATFVNWLKKNVVDKIRNFFEHPEKFIDNIGKAADWACKVGKEIVTGLFRGLATLWEKLKEFISGFIFGWEDTLEINSPSKVFERIGKWIIEGLINGLKSAWGWLSRTAVNIATDLFNTFKDFFNIHSPSKLMHDKIGLNIGYGIGEGIEDSESYVTKSLSGIADAIANEIDAGAPSIHFANGTFISGLETVADKLSNIASIFQSISTMLSSMGGLKLPQIATGAIIPVKTRAINTSERENDNYGNDSAPVSAIDLKRIITLLEIIAENGKEKDFYIDGEKLFNWLVGKSDSYTKSHGYSAFAREGL